MLSVTGFALVRALRAQNQKSGSLSSSLRISGIPLILNELESEPDFWFWALRALTRANPVTDNMAGNLSTMTRIWLDWGREHGYH